MVYDQESYLTRDMMTPEDQRLEQAQSLFRAGKLEEAKALFSAIAALNAECGVALQGLGYVAGKQNEYEQAVLYLTQAQQYLPPSLELFLQLSYLCKLAGRHAESLSWIDQGLTLVPQDYEALSFRTGILITLGRYDEALMHLRGMISTYPQDPQLYFQVGQIYGVMGCLEDEISAYQDALALKPDALQVRVNLGVALRDQFKFTEAQSQFNQVIKLDPDHVGARTNRAQLNLLLGKMAQGWKDYEWRWLDGTASHGIEGPRWQTPKSVKTYKAVHVLVHAEQGFGDTLQFSRYVGLLKKLFPKIDITFRVQKELVSFLKPNFPLVNVVSEQDALVAYDAHLPLLSAPFALEKYIQNIPKLDQTYSVSQIKQQEWSDRLGVKTKPRIGLAWSGRPTHLNDKNRSISLDQFSDLLSEDCDFYSLQKEIRAEDLKVLTRESRLKSFSDEIVDFSDTAALCQHMDVVISVDTSVAHLAASLGRPTWVLLPHMPDWRWQLERMDTDWYESVRLFRQNVADEWPEVIARMQQALRQFIQVNTQK